MQAISLTHDGRMCVRGRLIVAIVLPAVVLTGLGGYAWADAADVVPGWITTAAPEPIPAPFIVADAVEPSPAPGTALAPLFDEAAPVQDPAAIQALAEALRADSRTGASTNVSVIDLITGDVLADVGAGDGQVPASTTKLLTGIAVLWALGPDFRTETTATYDAARGEVTLVAGGDMLLAADAGTGGDNPNTAALWGGALPAVGYAGLGNLADQVAATLSAQGVTSVRVSVDASDFPGPLYPVEWPSYALANGWAAPVTGLAVNVGKATDDEYGPRASDPAATAADVFAARLAERGIVTTRVGARQASGEVAGSVESAPLADVVAYMLHASDNTIAENLTRVLAVQRGAEATPSVAMNLVVAQLNDMGVDVTGLRLYDGAGFSTRNSIPPLVLTEALRAASLHESTQGVLGLLAEAGLTGTLDDRYVGAPAAGVMRGKTGSLTGVTSLAGIVITADGRPLLFAALADGMPYGQDGPRSAIDEFVNALAECGCAAP